MSAAKGRIEDNPISYIDSMLQYYMHVDPSTLTDEQWAEKFAQLTDIRERESAK